MVLNVWHLEHHTLDFFLVVFNLKSLIHCCEQTSIQHSSIQIDSICMNVCSKISWTVQKTSL